MYLSVPVHVRMYVRMYVRTCTYVRIRTYVYVLTYVRICMHVFFGGRGVDIRTYVHEYVRVLAHVCMCLHPHSIMGSIRLSGAVWQRWSRPTILMMSRRCAGT